MNIFYLSREVDECARWHVDAHVRKMCFEYAQLLTSAHCVLDHAPQHYGYPYPKSVPSHPCALWVRASRYHYEWLYDLLVQLCAEYTHRYQDKHFIERWFILKRLATPPLALRQPEHHPTWCSPPKCVHDDCKKPSTIASYRLEYRTHKKYDKKGNNMHRWTRRSKPTWIKEE